MDVIDTKWSDADRAFDKGKQAYLDWCKAIAILYAEGTATQEEIGARYDTRQEQVSYAIATAKDQRLCFKNINEVPKNKQVLYLLTTLPDPAFEQYCKPTTTQKDILAYKASLKKPAERKEEETSSKGVMAMRGDIKNAIAEVERLVLVYLAAKGSLPDVGDRLTPLFSDLRRSETWESAVVDPKSKAKHNEVIGIAKGLHFKLNLELVNVEVKRVADGTGTRIIK